MKSEEMIVIEDIKLFKTDRYKSEIVHFNMDNSWDLDKKDSLAYNNSVWKEIIEGEVFRNPNGDKVVCIGMAKKVQDAIGFPMEVFRNTRRIADYYREESFSLGQELATYREMPFLERLRFLFLGKKYSEKKGKEKEDE